MIGYERSTLDEHTWIPIIYGGAPPNFEEHYITHGTLFLIGPDEDTTEFPNLLLIHPSLLLSSNYKQW